MKNVLLFIFIVFMASPLLADTVTLRGIGKPEPIRKLVHSKVDYMSASDLFFALGAKADWMKKEETLRAYVSGRELVFQVSDTFCTVNDRKYNLVYPPFYRTDDLYLPINQTLFLLSDVFERVVIYDDDRGTITAVKEGYNISGIHFQEKVNGDLLEIMLTKKLNYELFLSEGNWINVTIHGGRVDANAISRRKPNDKVIAIRAFQFESSAQVSIQMRETILRYHDNYTADPHRIQVSIENTEFAPQLGDSAALVRHDTYNPIDVVVIDPGHGGDLEGATGRNGVKEKDVVLDIALRLEKLMDKDKRFTPVLTRRTDRTVGLEERADLANIAIGDLFVSIHVNASDQKSAVGFQTFFLAAAKSDEARITEMLENKDFQIEAPETTERGKKELDFIIMDVLQTEYLNQSKQLADAIQSELKVGLNINSRGIDQAGFVVLNKVQMPSALVEVAFLSNKVEQRLLAQEDFRQAAAESIYRGIVRFADKYDKEKNGNAGSQ
jgi:N-acetylmuramoyl-L-alanine amidase